jgi:uncharacterized protein
MTGGSATTEVAQDPWPTTQNLRAQVRETHTGVVVLVGDRAYKAKKPITTDFLDFSTPDCREHACEREVSLNRRLAPDSYFGVAHLSDPEGGTPEPVVVMRRYPDDVRLTSLIKNGEPVHQHLCIIAETLARFHRAATRGPIIDAQGSIDAVQARSQQNLIELQHHSVEILPAGSVGEVARLASRFVSGRAALFAQRITDHRIIDGHGDLLADDIFCMPGGPVLLDCLEFDDHLRYVDGVDDASFLAMDLEFLGRRDLGGFLLDEYSRRANDPAPRSLTDFYVAYRAAVRAKVDCIRVSQGRRDAAADARRHVDVAMEHLRAGAVRLIVIGGGPGTGKTTLSRALAQEIGAQVISSDDVRRKLQDDGVINGWAGELNVGLYTPANVAAVYHEMLRRADQLLAGGTSVILDATWRDSHQRQRARKLADETSSTIVELTCSISLQEAADRIQRRQASCSDATPVIAAALTDRGTDSDGSHQIDTSRPVAESVEQAQQICRLAT